MINIDHHPGNLMYRAMNWIDRSAAACGEMVYELIRELGAPLTLASATHIYVAILTDTGSFHYSNITPRTFDICRHCMEVGIDPPAIARSIFDSNNLGRLNPGTPKYRYPKSIVIVSIVIVSIVIIRSSSLTSSTVWR